MEFFPKLDKDMKDKNRDVTITIFNAFFTGGVNIRIKAEIHRFKSLLDGILSEPVNKKALDDLKERFGKYIDEKEIEKVFLLYMLVVTLVDVLEGAAKYLFSFSTLGSLGYYLYRDENIFGGKLDEKTFIELLWEINEYAKIKASKEQKDEQPK